MSPPRPRHLLVFVSSPGDVTDEREEAHRILETLPQRPAWKGKFTIDIERWDDPHNPATMDAHLTPQQAVDGSKKRPSECDVTVVILWSRMGTPLEHGGRRYVSGTEYEYEDAVRDAATQGRRVLLYKRTDKPQTDVDDPEHETKRQQYESVKMFFARFTSADGLLRGAVTEYKGVAAFQTRFLLDMESILRTLDDAERDPAAVDRWPPLRSPADRPPPPDPYPLLGPYEHPSTFAGRDRELDELERCVAAPQLVLCVHAPSGAGKTSLLMAGLAPRLRHRDVPVPVALERLDGDRGTRGLAPRVIARLFELEHHDERMGRLADGHPGHVGEFVRWIEHARDMAGTPPVILLDQLDDVLRRDDVREAALACLGPLLAATAAARDPVTQAFPCRWVLCYRDDFHGTVDAWLPDVLGPARRAGLDLDPRWPTTLVDPAVSRDYVHSYAVPLLGMPPPGADFREAAVGAFRGAIEQPLTVRRVDGQRQYPITFSDRGAARLADAFAALRRDHPHAPLVAELQVVLGHLLERAGWTPRVECRVDVGPDPAALEEHITAALTTHLKKALDEAFPLRGDDAEQARQRANRARLLLVLRELVDPEGRRGAPRTQDELSDAIGADAAEVLKMLSGSRMRLIVAEGGDAGLRYGLSHDRLAEVVAAQVEAARVSGELEVDPEVVALRRFVRQRSDLFDAGDEAACTLDREQHNLIAANEQALLWAKHHRAWWRECQRWFDVSQRLEQDDFQALIDVTRQPNVEWDRYVKRLKAVRITPRLFWDAAWPKSSTEGTPARERYAPEDVLTVIERVHPAWCDAPDVARAMRHGVEETRRRHPDMNARARAVDTQLRDGLEHERFPAFRGDRWHLPDDDFLGFVAIRDEQPFRMGSNPTDDPAAYRDEVWPDSADGQGRVRVPDFYMGRYPVTVAQYRVFMEETGHKGDPSVWQDPPEAPVVNVTWDDALAYCRWLERLLDDEAVAPGLLRQRLQEGWHVTLPSEAEWEKGARGTDGRIYPWEGDAIDPGRANYRETGLGRPSLVGSFPRGASPYGLLDMSGNVWEWTRSLWGEDPYEVGYPYPYRPDDGREDLTAPDRDLRVVRGGSFVDVARFLRAARRGRGEPDYRYTDVGFRVVVSPFSSDSDL